MTAVIARIILRYGAGALVAKGLLSADLAAGLTADQDITAIAEIAAGAIIGVGTEFAYYCARRFGWSK